MYPDCFEQTYAAEGRFTFTSHAAGEHIICLNSNSTAWLYAGQLVSLCTTFCMHVSVCVCVRLCGYEDLCCGRCGLWSLNCMLWQNLFILKVKISKDVTWKQQTYHMRDLSRYACEFMRWGGRTLTKKQNLFLVNTLQNSFLSWQFFLICTVWQF